MGHNGLSIGTISQCRDQRLQNRISAANDILNPALH